MQRQCVLDILRKDEGAPDRGKRWGWGQVSFFLTVSEDGPGGRDGDR